MMFIDLAPGLEHVRAGTLRALAVTTKERSALLPDLPSLHEAGIPGYDVTSWAGLFAPAGTPKEIVMRLNEEVRKMIANPDVKARIAVTGFDAFSGRAGNAGRVRAVRARQLGQVDQGRRHRAAVSSPLIAPPSRRRRFRACRARRRTASAPSPGAAMADNHLVLPTVCTAGHLKSHGSDI